MFVYFKSMKLIVSCYCWWYVSELIYYKCFFRTID